MSTFKSLKVQKQYRAYQDEQLAIVERQKHWLDTLRPKLIETLEGMIKANNIDGKIDTEEDASNMKPVYLTLGTVKSGLEQIKGEANNFSLPYLKEKGGLLYSPIYNGKITAVVKLPVIKNLTKVQPPKVIDIVEPTKLTPQKIEDHLVEFFQALLEWEDQVSPTNPIGF